MHCLQRLKTILQSKLFYLFLFLVLFIWVLLKTVVIKYNTKYYDSSSIEGIITDVSIKNNQISFILKNTEKIKCSYYSKNIIYKVTDLLGKKVQVFGEPTKINKNTIPNTFNYQKYLYNNKIYLAYKVKDIKITSKENIFYQIKNKIIKRVSNYDNLSRSYLNLFILGDKDFLESETYEQYRTNGIWHLFAVSGMHIGLIILVLDKVLKRFKISPIIISIVLSYFMFLTNFSASVLRATFFYFFKNLCHLFKLSLDNRKILFLVAFTILIINPFMIYNNGFQYSFLITFSIMTWSKHLTGNYLTKIFKISLLAFIVSLPITVNLNYEINFLSLILNIIFVPFISLIVFPLSILTFGFSFLEPILSFCLIILEYLNNFLYSWKLNLIIPKIPIIVITLYYTFLFLYTKKLNKIYLTAIFLLIPIHIFLASVDKNYHVYYLDVGQGDCSILISPFRKEVIMIDTGGALNSDYHVSNNVILFLKSLGIKKIDLLIISHGDADHAKETINILKKYSINNIILNKGNYNLLEQEISKVGHIVMDYQSKYFNYKNINDYYNSDENYSSQITYFDIFNYHFLYMGDSPKEVELQLIDDYNIKCDFLKLGHHGSKTSSGEKFLKNFNLKKAIISSGRNNLYHHPSKETIKTLEKLNISYLNTKESGTIEITINKNNYTITTYEP